MVGHALAVDATVLTQAERVAALHVQCIASSLTGVVGQACLRGIVPFEQTVAADESVEDERQCGHLTVGIGSNEATAVAATVGKGGEGDHIATLELEGADAVVQLLGSKGVHESAVVPEIEVAARLTGIVLLAVNGKGLDVLVVGQHDGASVVELHLTVGAVDGLRTIDLDMGHNHRQGL